MTYTVTFEPERGQVTIRTTDRFEMAIAIEDLPSDVAKAKALIEGRLLIAKAVSDAETAAEADRIVLQSAKIASLQSELEGKEHEVAVVVDEPVPELQPADAEPIA